MLLLPREDIAANLPLEEDKFSVNRDRGFELRRPDPLLESPRNFSYPFGTDPILSAPLCRGFIFESLFFAIRGSSLTT